MTFRPAAPLRWPSLATAICAPLFIFATAARSQTAPENIALHRPVTFSEPPNYALSSDADDALQLTDGRYSSDPHNQRELEGSRAIWVQTGTVGWQFKSPIITIDLGQIQPISGLSISTAAGQAGVHWPAAAYIAVSDDGKQWHYSGDLVALANKTGAPNENSYQTHIYRTDELATHGRYVALAVDGKPYIFLDEIEVYKGPETLLQRPAPGQTISSLKDWTTANQIHGAELERLRLDAATINREIDAAKIAPDRKSALQARLQRLISQFDQLPLPDTASFRTTIPQNSLQADIWAVYGSLLSVTYPPLVAWKSHRFAFENLAATPPRQAAAPALSIELMGHEKRSDSFLLTNATAESTTARIKLTGPIANLRPSWLTVNKVAWTDTHDHIPVADALLTAPFRNGAYEVALPAGLTRKIWLTVDSTTLTSGLHRGTIVVEAGGRQQKLPFSVRVSKLQLPRPRLGLGMWDYTEGSGLYGITRNNRAATMRLMKAGLVDSPWATNSVLPWPVAADFDAQDNLKAPLSFARLDAWIKEWPEARRYFVFANVQREFAGAAMGTPSFNTRVGGWAKALVSHCIDRGMKPEKLAILLVDEPETDEEDERIVAWGTAINGAAPELTLFQDPVWPRPDQNKNQAAITLADIVCPDLTQYTHGGTPVAEYFRVRQAAGQQLWFYQCSGPTRTYSPSRYYRQQAWHAFAHGATGIGFWSMGDLGNAPSSWNEYLASWKPYVPIFLGTDDATDSIHWQAVREGLQDYEYFALLRDASQRTKNAGLRAEATNLLKAMPLSPIPTKAIEGTFPEYEWSQPENPASLDTYRLKVLTLLERMS